ncbi:MAG TPA: TolC family protein [Geothrix sp.]|nr:TolC family protein [Geothrix sp.]
MPSFPALSMSMLSRTALCLLATGLLDGQEAAAPLRLTHEQALQLGVTNLLQTRIARELREEIRQVPEFERGIFDWQLSANAFTGKLEYGDLNPRTSGLNNLYLTSSSTTLEARAAGLGLSKLTPWGGSFNFTMNSGFNAFAVQQTNQTLPTGPAASLGYDTLNPYSGRMSLSFSQPLLKGFGPSVTQAKLRAALEEAKGADDTFRQRLAEILTSVDGLYWDLVYARQNLENKKLALELSRKQLEEDKERVNSGMLARIELPAVEATVVEREKQLYAAQARLKNAETALVARLFPYGDKPEAVELSDSPEMGPEPVALKKALEIAEAHRPELSAAGYGLKARQIQETAAKNATLPQLDTQVAVNRGSNSRPDVSGVWDDVSQNRYPGYYVGLAFAFPLENHAARARHLQAKAATRSAEYLLKDIQTSVALDVQQAYTDLTSARKEAEAADKALVFRTQSLEAEMAKLENGMSTSFFVLQRQDELDQARAAHLEARIAVEKARTGLERAMGTLVDPYAR